MNSGTEYHTRHYAWETKASDSVPVIPFWNNTQNMFQLFQCFNSTYEPVSDIEDVEIARLSAWYDSSAEIEASVFGTHVQNVNGSVTLPLIAYSIHDSASA